MDGIQTVTDVAKRNGHVENGRTNGHQNGIIRHPVNRNVLLGEALTDIGNAMRLMHYHGEDLRYSYQAKRWYIWDGRRWAEDRTGEIQRRAESVTNAILKEAQSENDNAKRKEALIKWAHTSMSNASIKNMIERAQNKAPVQFEDLDRDPWLLNCLNGTIDLRTGELREHRQSDYITKLIPVEYDPQAVCPTWNDFLFHIMGERDHLVAFLQRAVGYALTGNTREQVIFILHGSGANGKSTFLNTLLQLVSDYGSQTPAETLMAKKGTSIPNDIARLRGARFVSAVETEQGKRLSEVLVKQLTGGDVITARFLNQEFFEFTPEFKIFMATNHKPEIRGTDEGIWRRLPLIPFEVTIPPEQRDKALPEKLRAELSGIFNWAIVGCRLWLQEGLKVPSEVVEATASYRAEMDTLQTFFDEHCVQDASATCNNTDIYREYSKWAEDSGEFKQAQKWLTQRLKERGFTQSRGSGGKVRYWHGIGLLNEPQKTLV
jgi:putative DNA primase/helicase